MTLKIGVIGSATQLEQKILAKAEKIGRGTAKNDCITLSGSAPGASYAAIRAAKNEKGLTIGFSPASNITEHSQKYKFPTDDFDVLVYTGFGLEGRNVIFVRTCDAVILISGRIGTLNEFTIAYAEGKTIGILTTTGGIADKIEEIISICGKKGGYVIYDSNPTNLVNKVVESFNNKNG